MHKTLIFLFLILNSIIGQAQMDTDVKTDTKTNFRIHSHNDYLQNVPFWKALSAGARSVEADVFLVGDSLYVAHTEDEIDTARSFERIYLESIREALETGIELPGKLQLLIDIKSEPYTTLDAVIKSLQKYPSIIKGDAIAITISGNRPEPSEYVDYPEYINFDYQSLDAIDDPSILKKIALISLSFRDFSEWNGKGKLTAGNLKKVSATIDKAHALGKPFRFWATPDSKTAWKAFAHLGVDFVNTDKPFECAAYLKTLPNREYQNTVFSEVYRPSFDSDGKPGAVKNIILLIGDGNGLAQISATALANNGELSLTQLKNIGFLKTQSADDFTTDSAGAGTAIATGQKVPNRAIGTDSAGHPVENITELLHKKGFLSGIITTDEITGATPSAFYAHRKDRGMTDGIREDLSNSSLSVFVSTADTSQSLSTAVKNGLQSLEQKGKPFFIMAEGAKIDSYGHANDIGGIINEGIAFDQAVSEALKYADAHSNTLVIITADHETGGLSLPQGNIKNHEIEGDFTTDDHTGLMVPIFAYGPQSNTFQGVYENNELFHKMLEVLKVSQSN